MKLFDTLKNIWKIEELRFLIFSVCSVKGKVDGVKSTRLPVI